MGSMLLQNEMIRLAAVTIVTVPIEHGNSNSPKYHLKSYFDVFGIAGSSGYRRFMYDDIDAARKDYMRLLQALGWYDTFMEQTPDYSFLPGMPKPAEEEGWGYQFQVDNRAMGSPIRRLWKEAAQDAVNAGYARWIAHACNNQVALDEQASIVRVSNKPIAGRYGFEEDEGD